MFTVLALTCQHCQCLLINKVQPRLMGRSWVVGHKPQEWTWGRLLQGRISQFILRETSTWTERAAATLASLESQTWLEVLQRKWPTPPLWRQRHYEPMMLLCGATTWSWRTVAAYNFHIFIFFFFINLGAQNVIGSQCGHWRHILIPSVNAIQSKCIQIQSGYETQV